MQGNIHLSTHRLLFHALLPPDEAFVRHYDSSEEFETMNTPIDKTHVLHSGPVTWHRHKLNSSQRVWMELSAEMITTYPSADEAGRVRPIKSILRKCLLDRADVVSTIDSLRPIDEAKPSDIHLTFRDQHILKSYFFTVDTPQSAAQWRRTIEAALFRLLRVKWRNSASTRLGKEPESSVDQWNTLRYCVPLDRLTVTEVGDYHGFATLVSLRVSLDKPQKLITPAMRLADAMANLQHLHLAREADSDLTFNFNLAVITKQESFVDHLNHAIEAAHLRHPRGATPQMSFSIAGLDFLAEDEEDHSAEEAETPSESLPAKIARKAEKAHMAARAFGLDEEEGIWCKSLLVRADHSETLLRGHQWSSHPRTPHPDSPICLLLAQECPHSRCEGRTMCDKAKASTVLKSASSKDSKLSPVSSQDSPVSL